MDKIDSEQFWRKANQFFSNDQLELTIMPTEQCNFRCTYCYEDFNKGRMSAKTVSALKKYLSRRASELQYLQIRWFGGEPLIVFDIIEEISSYATGLSLLYPGLRHEGSVTTNAWHLNLEKAARLSSLNVKNFQITLDGPKEFHDRTRVQANSRGTYDVIHENLRSLRDSSLDISIELRLHLMPDNLDKIEDYAMFLENEYLLDPRFKLEPFPVGHLGGANDESFSVLDFTEAMAAMGRIRNRRKSLSPPAAKATETVPKDRYVCYAARGNAYVIRADGSIGKCTVALNDPRNNIGTLSSAGEMKLKEELIRPWLSGWQAINWSALQCPLDDLQGDQPWKNISIIKKGIKP